MNLFAPPRYAEGLTRLALGVEVLDALDAGRVPAGSRVLLERYPPPLDTWRRWAPHETLDDALPALRRHRSGRFSLLHDGHVPPSLVVRVRDERRRHVPRRIRVTLPTLAAIEAADEDHTIAPPPLARRALQVLLHPGAGHDLVSGATVLRGRLVRPDPGGGPATPVRWARVRANARTTAGEELGWAHGDDRGEFLLAVAAPAGAVGFLDDPVEIRIHVSRPTTAPTPDPGDPRRPELDPLWDLPIENVPLPTAAATGRSFLPAHTTAAPIDVDLPIGSVTARTFLIP